MRITSIIGAIALLSLFMVAASAIETYEPYSTATGRYVTPAEWLGGPWYHTNYGVTFGNSKTATIKYLSSTSRLTLAGADVAIPENLIVTKSLTVTGLTTIGGLVNAGVIEQDLKLGANHYFRANTGTGAFDIGRMSGDMQGVAGMTRLNGTYILAGKNLFAGGPTKVDKISINNSAIINGNLYLWGSSRETGTAWFGAVKGNATISTPGIATLGATIINNSQITSGNSYLWGSGRTTGTQWMGNIKGNGTLTNAGLATLNQLKLNSTVAWSGSAILTSNTTLTAATLTTIVLVDTTSRAVVVTLPEASTVTAWTPVWVTDIVAPTASNYVGVTVQSSILGYTGAPGLRTADTGAGLVVMSDGVSHWWILPGRTGTWAHYP